MKQCCNIQRKWRKSHANVPYCLVVRIPGFHPGGPGSIPGMGINVRRWLWFKINSPYKYKCNRCFFIPISSKQGSNLNAQSRSLLKFRPRKSLIRTYWRTFVACVTPHAQLREPCNFQNTFHFPPLLFCSSSQQYSWGGRASRAGNYVVPIDSQFVKVVQLDTRSSSF